MRHLGIFVLAFQQYLGLALIASVLPVVLRADGAGLEMIGLFSAAMFAFTINFLWAPLVDRKELGWGRWRGRLRGSWLFATQLVSALLVGIMALLDPARDVFLLFLVGITLSVVVATQRIATLGYVADVLAPAERGMGTALMGCGAAVANAIGGAACLALVAAMGWHFAILVFAGGMLALGLVLLRLPEPQRAPVAPRHGPFRLILGTSLLWQVVGCLAPAAFGIALAFAMALPRLVDAGIDMENVGFFGAGANLLSFFICAPLAGIVVARMKSHQAVTGSCLLLAVLLALVCISATTLQTRTAAIVALLVVFAALAIQHVAFTNWFLGLARPGQTAADVTFLTAILAAIALAGFAASGWMAEHLGYDATLWAAAGGYGLSAVLVMTHARCPAKHLQVGHAP